MCEDCFKITKCQKIKDLIDEKDVLLNKLQNTKIEETDDIHKQLKRINHELDMLQNSEAMNEII